MRRAGTRFGKLSVGLCASALVSAAFVAALAAPAGAAGGVTWPSPSCEAFLWSNGTHTTDTGKQPLPDQTLPAVSGPNIVFNNTNFNATGSSTSIQVPSSQFAPPLNATVTVAELKNIITTIEVDGAAGIGSPSLSGGGVLNPTAVKSGAKNIVLTFPGSQNGSLQTGGTPGTAYFPGGSTFTTPQLTLPLTSGAAGTTISAHLVSQEFDVDVLLGATHLAAHLVCTPTTDIVLGSIVITQKPAPGAPTAVGDTATTKQGKAVTIDVLGNDVADAQQPIAADSLAITQDPGHGTAAINADHTVTYTPSAGFHGTDSFKYQICSTAEEQPALKKIAAQFGPCSEATVSVTVQAPVTPTTTTPTTVKKTGNTTVTTVAAAVTTNELPRTGGSSGPLGLVALALIGAGIAALRLGRRRIV